MLVREHGVVDGALIGVKQPSILILKSCVILSHLLHPEFLICKIHKLKKKVTITLNLQGC